ncbi:MAG: molybdopterin molybdotransferase MoeA, partial [Gemmataceae bacterium]
ELAAPGTPLAPGQIANSNGPMLETLVAQAGATPISGGILRDDPAAMNHEIALRKNEADVLLFSGGVSVGGRDHLPAVLEQLGLKLVFHSVRMKPGKPLLFGTLDGLLVFGLPGNPVSSLVGFELFVRLAIESLRGQATLSTTVSLILEADFQADNNRPTYHPAVVHESGSTVRALPWFGSPDLRGVSAANAFLVLPPGVVSFSAGESVMVNRMMPVLSATETG